MTPSDRTDPAPDGFKACAPFIARILLSTHTGDKQGILQASADAIHAGVDMLDLVVQLSHILVSNLNSTGEDWQSSVRLGLLEMEANS